MIGSHWDFDMLFSIVKVRSSLNYSIIGLKIKHIQGGIIDNERNSVKLYGDILCWLLIFPRSQAYSRYWQRKTNNRFTETSYATGHSATGHNATGYSECNGSQWVQRVTVQRVTVSATGHSKTGDHLSSLNKEHRHIAGPSTTVLLCSI